MLPAILEVVQPIDVINNTFLSPSRMNEEARKIFTELGSSIVKDLAFRDNWVFVGAKGVQDKSPFEQVFCPFLSLF